VRRCRYTPIQPLDVVAEEIGVPIEQLAKLDANENLYGPMPEVVEAIANAAGMHIYPDPNQTYFRQDLASYVGLTPGHVIAGGVGSDELLDLIIRLCEPGSGIVTAPPTFSMYSFLAKLARSKVIEVDRSAGPDFELDVDGIVDAVRNKDGRLVFIASPNNPTGGLVSAEQVERICKESCLLVVDEAYAEFSGGSMVELVNSFPNLIILRTFSKWAGLAGMRVGFAVAHPKIIEKLATIKQPYNINVATEAAARAALAVRDKIREQHINPILAERTRMLILLQEFQWLEPNPSVANFVLFKVHEPYCAALVHQGLRKLGVLVRYYSGGALANFFRISVGRPADTALLVDGLRKLVASGSLIPKELGSHNEMRVTPQALILDMDGVLAEVSMSYRRAIQLTCETFGVVVTASDISKAKLEGNANDDWKLTHRLISQGLPQGNGPTLEQVTEEFQKFYIGTDKSAGLRDLESLIPPRSLLVEMRRRCPLGMAIVTGRPREECLHFLNIHNLRSIFSDGEGNPLVVCMHDAPSKPSPAPVQLALQRLGGVKPNLAVMIGDTPDDITAAKAAGVGAIGVLTPDCSSRDLMKKTLTACGAMHVMEPGFSHVLELFPPASSVPANQHCTQGNRPMHTRFGQKSSGRVGTIERNTKETSIEVRVALDGTGESDVHTGLGFLDHMICAMSKHSRVDIQVKCQGDVWIDDHHTAEDVGIALGEAFDIALGERKGIARFGHAYCPLDEALSRAVVDVSSRPHSEVDLQLRRDMIGSMSSEMLEHFIASFTSASRMTVHVHCIHGKNDHHKAESAFKALAVALRKALASDASAGIPSTKGFLS